MRRHLAWILPLALIPIAYIALRLVFTAYGENDADSGASMDLGYALLLLAALGVWLVGTIYLTIKAITNGYRVFRSFRRGKGHYTRTEQAQRDLQLHYEDSWNKAQALTGQLSRGHLPPAMQVWGVVLEPGENLHLQITADYARFYGSPGTYVHTSGFFWGQPAFVLAGVGVTALANNSRRRAAEAASRQHWRDARRTAMFLTDRRILCQVDGRWLSFHYSHVAACYPEPENNSVVLEFHQGDPLLIGGPEAPLAAAYIVWALYGANGLTSHPALGSLRG
ncbi:hypothetical protein H9639_07020 [Arthrobacter sp. Sa2CUA1]|uniref:DUF3592 domain-containing protein n=1 Tax=Arthrobacter gallicola TaxID=2762225 RepID=A0ABR8UR59_9MICC|nr:hypothetical protein [Arthrobacter gallicola]MBD7995044.1 hypothetical protein [Arthrobacter gallicola]